MACNALLMILHAGSVNVSDISTLGLSVAGILSTFGEPEKYPSSHWCAIGMIISRRQRARFFGAIFSALSTIHKYACIVCSMSALWSITTFESGFNCQLSGEGDTPVISNPSPVMASIFLISSHLFDTMTGPTPLSVCMTVYLRMISGGMFSLVLCIVISSGFSVLGGPTVSDKDFARRCMPPAALKLGWSCPNMLITDTVAFPCELKITRPVRTCTSRSRPSGPLIW